MTTEPEQIAAFLRANPRFLADRPKLYAALAPPRRVHGDRLADHMAAMLEIARQDVLAEREGAASVLEAGRAAQGLAARAHVAVLALLRAADPTECITVEWPGLLGVDAARICVESARPGWHTVPHGTIDGLLGQRSAVVRSRPADAQALHAEAALLAETDALIRIPGAPPALLALVCRDGAALCGHATEALTFLGAALGVLLRR